MIAIALGFSAMLGLLVTSSSDRNDTAVRKGSNGTDPTSARLFALTAHDPILIDGNAGFTNESGVVWGSGTTSDPYIIEGWDIDTSSANGTEIRNANVNFVVRNCDVSVSGLDFRCIRLLGCRNGNLSNNTCSGGVIGIDLWKSTSNSLVNNNCSQNDLGIGLDHSSNNYVSGNNCSDNYYGILIPDSDGNVIDNNTCLRSAYGIELAGLNNVLTRNQLLDSYHQGVYIAHGSYNLICNNVFVGNNGAGSVYDSSHAQAYDDGTSNLWNSTDGYGNYWSDWTTPDDALPYGIVDIPYNISGSAGAKDNFPLTTPQAPIPEFGMMPFVVVGLVAAILLTIGVRRRKAR
jgi:parallel beta-helix repeat protein